MTKVCLSALTVALALSNFVSPAFGRELNGVEGKKHLVQIPARELTRISIDNGRLQNMQYLTDELEVQQDKAAGAVYVKPRVEKQISVFVTSASGSTHQLILQPVDTMPLESIVIKEPISRSKDAKAIEARASSTDVAVKRMVLLMARGERSSIEARCEQVNQPLALWNEARFVMTTKCKGLDLHGEQFKLTNVSNGVMKVAEQEFYKPGVLAVSVDGLILRPGESSDVYVIKGAHDE